MDKFKVGDLVCGTPEGNKEMFYITNEYMYEAEVRKINIFEQEDVPWMKIKVLRHETHKWVGNTFHVPMDPKFFKVIREKGPKPTPMFAKYIDTNYPCVTIKDMTNGMSATVKKHPDEIWDSEKAIAMALCKLNGVSYYEIKQLADMVNDEIKADMDGLVIKGSV